MRRPSKLDPLAERAPDTYALKHRSRFPEHEREAKSVSMVGWTAGLKAIYRASPPDIVFRALTSCLPGMPS